MNKSLIGAGELLRTTWDEFKSHWRFHLDVSIRLFAAMTISSLAGIFFFSETAMGSSGKMIVGALLILGALILNAHTTIVAFAAYIKRDRGESVTTLNNDTGWRLFLPNIVIAILQFLAIFGGFILLIIPGIWLSVRLLFSNLVLIDEDKRGVAALKRSSELVKGYWWDVFLLNLVAGLVFGLLMVVTGMLIGFLVAIIAGMGNNTMVNNVLSTVVTSAVQGFFYPPILISLVKIYNSLHKVKSGS